MPKFILKLTQDDEMLPIDESIYCYVLSSKLKNLSDLISWAKQTDNPVLLVGEKALDLCLQYKCDGVFIEMAEDSPYKKQLRPLRDKLGAKKIIGVQIPIQRHAAMIVGETEPEFMAFSIDSTMEIEKIKEFLSWYNELFLIPSVACGSAQIELLERLDTDFVMISPRNYKILVAKNESLD